MKEKIIVILLSVTLNSCIDPYEFKGIDQDSYVVVDGYITNEKKVHTIRLTKTIGFSNYRNEAVTGASVSIVDDIGNNEQFHEIGNGYYGTSEDFRAIKGRYYTLEITTKNDEYIKSDPVNVLSGNSPIELTYKGAVRQYRRNDGKFRQKEFVDIFLSIENTRNDDKYYKWDVHPFYIFHAPVAPRSREWCYIEGFKLTEISILHDRASGNVESQRSVLLASVPYGYRMKYDFRLKVRQLSIDKGSYEFWNDIKRQRENIGSILDPLPVSPSGNLKNLTDSTRFVMGYFGAYSVDSLVIHFNESDLPFDKIPERWCELVLGAYPVGCLDCTEWTDGDWISPQRPDWW